MYYEIEKEVSRNLDQVNIYAEIKAALLVKIENSEERCSTEDMVKNTQGSFDTWYHK